MQTELGRYRATRRIENLAAGPNGSLEAMGKCNGVLPFHQQIKPPDLLLRPAIPPLYPIQPCAPAQDTCCPLKARWLIPTHAS
jgi:hypothetical protein